MPRICFRTDDTDVWEEKECHCHDEGVQEEIEAFRKEHPQAKIMECSCYSMCVCLCVRAGEDKLRDLIRQGEWEAIHEGKIYD